MRRVASLATALTALLAAFCAGCGFEGATKQELMTNAGCWFTGVTELNYEFLAKYDANAPAPGSPEFAAWTARVRQAVETYEQQKLTGKWTPDPIGYGMVRALNVGRNPGTYWGAPSQGGTTDEPTLVVQPSFGYDEIAEQNYPKGTALYLQGYPVGTAYRVEIGGEKKAIDILDQLQLKIRFRRAKTPVKDGPKYQVVGWELIDGTAKHRMVQWTY